MVLSILPGISFVGRESLSPQLFQNVHLTASLHPAKTICSAQSRQAILTVLVARTELPQQGQTYFRVLDVLGGRVVVVPLWVPVPVTR